MGTRRNVQSDATLEGVELYIMVVSSIQARTSEEVPPDQLSSAVAALLGIYKTIQASNLQGLVSLIQKATDDAILAYEDSGAELPSLDVPSEPPTNIIALRKALRVLEGACFQLCATLAPPEATVFSRSSQCLDVGCLRVAVAAKIPDILAGHPDGLHVSEIAKAAGMEPGKLSKVLRSLAVRHCFREVAADTYTNNRLSITLLEANPLSALIQFVATDVNRYVSSNIYETLVDPVYGPSYDANRTAWSYGIRHEAPEVSIYEWLTEHTESGEVFNRAMVGAAQITDVSLVVKAFPWRDLPGGATVTDVGGGYGTVSIELAKQYPHLQLTVQDLPTVVKQARQFWDTNYPVALTEKRINFVPLDFLNESPVKEQDVYYLRQIIHNWPAEACVTILKNIAKVLKPESRILIHDYVLQPNFSGQKARELASGSGVDVAPKPLLPNYGYGNSRAYTQDISMLTLTNAGERTLDEFLTIGTAAGLRFVKLWDFAETALIEFAAS